MKCDSDTSSEGDKSDEKDDIQSDMQRVFALIDYGLNEDKTKFDLKAEEEKYCDECNEALNDNKIVGCVVAEPTYEADDYKTVDHTYPLYDDCQYVVWPPWVMPHEKMELECEFFTDSRFSGNNLGVNLDPIRVHPEVAWEIKRRPTSNAPSNLSPESLRSCGQKSSHIVKQRSRLHHHDTR